MGLGLILIILLSGCKQPEEPQCVRNRRYVRAFVFRFASEFDEAKYRKSDQQFVLDIKAKLTTEGYLSTDAYGREMSLDIDVSKTIIRAWSLGRNGIDESGEGDDYMVETPYYE